MPPNPISNLNTSPPGSSYSIAHTIEPHLGVWNEDAKITKLIINHDPQSTPMPALCKSDGIKIQLNHMPVEAREFLCNYMKKLARRSKIQYAISWLHYYRFDDKVDGKGENGENTEKIVNRERLIVEFVEISSIPPAGVIAISTARNALAPLNPNPLQQPLAIKRGPDEELDGHQSKVPRMPGTPTVQGTPNVQGTARNSPEASEATKTRKTAEIVVIPDN